MASSVRFDTSSNHINQYTTKALATQLNGKEVSNARKQVDGASISYDQRSVPLTNSHLSKQFRSSPVKQTSSEGSNSNLSYAQEFSENLQITQKMGYSLDKPQIKSEHIPLAGQLFTTSEEDEDQASDNYVLGEDDGGDPVTAGDSDFEPPEQSSRFAESYHQKTPQKRQTAQFDLESQAKSQIKQYDQDEDIQNLFQQDHFQDAIDYKLANEHDLENQIASNIRSKQLLGALNRVSDNSNAVLRLRSSISQQQEILNYNSLNSNNFDLHQTSSTIKHNIQSNDYSQNNTTKIFKEISLDSSSVDSSYDSPQKQVSSKKQQEYFTKNKFAKQQEDQNKTRETFEAAKRSSNSKKQNLPQSKTSLSYTPEQQNEQISKKSTTPIFTAIKSIPQEQKISTSNNVRRFARNTGNYQSSFSKPISKVTSQINQDDQQSADYEADQYLRQTDCDQNNIERSYSSEENQLLLDNHHNDLKSQYYYESSHDPSSQSIEMQEIKNKTIHEQSSSEQLETDYFYNSRNNQKQAALNLVSENNKIQKNHWVESADDNESSTAERFKSTAVGFSPNQQIYFQDSSAKIQSNEQQSANREKPETHQSKSMTSFGWSSQSEQRKKQLSPNPKESTGLQSYRDTQSSYEQAQQYGQYAKLYPQKDISTTQFQQTQLKNSQSNRNVDNVQGTLPAQKEKRKKKKEPAPEAHFLLTGVLSQYLETRTFYRNSEQSKTQNSSNVLPQSNSAINLDQNKDAGSREALMTWFESLSLQDRVNSLTTTYPIFVQSIIDAQVKHIRQNGPLCLFTIKKEKSVEVQQAEVAGRNRRTGQQQIETENTTVFERCHTQDDPYIAHNGYYQDTSVRQFQTKLIKLTRITKNKHEHDTLTVGKELVTDAKDFFSLMENLTDGKAFSQPLTFVTRNVSGGRPLIQSPCWIDNKKTNYLAVWIAVILEETLWAHFNFVNQVNISAGIRKQELYSLFELRSENLQNQDDLAKRWEELKPEGQMKLLSQLGQKAKDESFQKLLDEQERRIPPHTGVGIGYNPAVAGHHSYQDDIYQFVGTSRYGLYSFAELPTRQLTDIYRPVLDVDNNQFYGRQTYLDQQGLMSGQSRCQLISIQGDSDLKEIQDMTTYVAALDSIKFLSEIPLTEINQKNYIRKHLLCLELFFMIQADLRQSIQDQLMNELLAIDSAPNSKSSQLSDVEADKKNKNKKKQDVRKNKRKSNNGQQSQSTATIATYQKKKSISKSPEQHQQQTLNQTITSPNIESFITLQSQPKDQPKSIIDNKNNQQSNQNTARKQQEQHKQQVVSQVSSSTTIINDHQVATSFVSTNEKSQSPKVVNSTKIQKQKQSGQNSKNSKDNGKKQSDQYQTKQIAEQSQKKNSSPHSKDQKQISKVEKEDQQQEIVQGYVRQLLTDIVESVVTLENERLNQIEQQRQQELSESEKQDQVLGKKDESEDSNDDQGNDKNLSQTLASSQQTNTPPVSQQQQKESGKTIVNQQTNPQQAAATTTTRKRKRKTQKKQDAEELVNNFMRKLQGADEEDKKPIQQPKREQKQLDQ